MRWGLSIGGALVALAALFFVLRTQSTPPVSHAGIDATQNHPGRDLYESFGCSRCHESGLTGSRKGPPLLEAAHHWNVEDLVAFLREPTGFTKDARLRALVEQYRPVEMPAFRLREDVLLAVADYVLAFSRAELGDDTVTNDVRPAVATIDSLSARASAPDASRRPNPSSTLQRTHPLTLEDLSRIVWMSDLTWSPAEDRLALVTTALEAASAPTRSALGLLDLQGRMINVVEDTVALRGASWSPDAGSIAFARRSAASAGWAGWLWRVYDGELQALPQVEGGLRTPPVWSPRGDGLAAVASPLVPGEEPGLLVLMRPDRDGGFAVEYHEGTRVAQLSWAPDGARLAVVWANVSGAGPAKDLFPTHGQGPPLVQAGRLHLGVLEMGDLESLDWLQAPGSVLCEPPAWSRDGRYLAVRSLRGSGPEGTPTEGEAPRLELRVWDTEEGRARVVHETAGLDLGPPSWLGGELLLPRRLETKLQLFTRSPGPSSIPWRSFSDGLEHAASSIAPHGVAVSPSERRVAYIRSTPRMPDEVMLADLEEQSRRRLSRVHLGLLRKGLASVESAEVPIANGTHPALLVYPNSTGTDAPWPCMVLLSRDDENEVGVSHDIVASTRNALPPSSVTTRFDPVAQLLASRGYLVVKGGWRDASEPSLDETIRELQRRGLVQKEAPELFDASSLDDALHQIRTLRTPVQPDR